MFGNWQVKTDSASKANLGGKSPNIFDLGRAYLTFRMPAGDNGAIRVTTDIFQNTNPAQNAYYQGWVVRLKYGYLQYTGARNSMGPGSNLIGRLGMLHTVTIDYEELYWPRYLQQVGLEKNGFFSSSDVGIAGLATLGNRWGEIYGLIDNGSGYTSYDNPGTTGQPVTSNRFKDLGLRVSLTPFANDPSKNHYIRYLSISPWGYLGFNGNVDLAIAIRTGVVKDGTLYVQAAAGIVADSIPENEWLETRNKARALLAAAEQVHAGLDAPLD